MNIAPAKQMLIFIIQGAQRQRYRCSTPPVSLLNSAGRGARFGAEYSGRRIYEGEISRFEAAAEYGIGSNTAREYMRLYRAEHHLPVRHVESNAEKIKEPPRPPARLEDYEAMSKEELIQELVRAKIVEARLKKGYEVKGAGAQKEFALLDSKSTR
jgi:transposase